MRTVCDVNMRGFSRMLCVFLVLFLCAVLAGCSAREDTSTYTVTRNGKVYTVDTVNCTVTEGTNVFRYEYSGSGRSYNVNITYPDGSTFWWKSQKSSDFVSSSHGGWSDDYDPEKYIDGSDLIDLIEMDIEPESEPKNVFLIFILLAVGIFNIAAPETAWMLEHGWRYKNAEPSDMALDLNRIGGGFAIIVAIFMWFG